MSTIPNEQKGLSFMTGVPNPIEQSSIPPDKSIQSEEQHQLDSRFQLLQTPHIIPKEKLPDPQNFNTPCN
jgi:hypothetical protein